MKKINEITTFSGALESMCKGLRKQEKNDSFQVSMTTYGESKRFIDGKTMLTPSGERMCFGCAATVTLMELANKQLTPKNIMSSTTRADALSFELSDLRSFERAMDDFRCGSSSRILKYFGIIETGKELSEALDKLSHYRLHSYGWQGSLKYYDVFVNTLKELGY